MALHENPPSVHHYPFDPTPEEVADELRAALAEIEEDNFDHLPSVDEFFDELEAEDAKPEPSTPQPLR